MPSIKTALKAGANLAAGAAVSFSALGIFGLARADDCADAAARAKLGVINIPAPPSAQTSAPREATRAVIRDGRVFLVADPEPQVQEPLLYPTRFTRDDCEGAKKCQ